MGILKESGIVYCQNNSGNTPLRTFRLCFLCMYVILEFNRHCSSDWAVQNQKLEAAKFLVANFDGLDVLQQNSSGRGALTDAFQTGNVELIDVCLGHPSSTEDKLLDKMEDKVKLTDNTTVEGEGDETPSITHEFALSSDPVYAGKTISIRELPITNADNPFGTDAAPEDDTTGSSYFVSFLVDRF